MRNLVRLTLSRSDRQRQWGQTDMPTLDNALGELDDELPTAENMLGELDDDILGEIGDVGSQTQFVHIRVQQRNGRKSITTLQNLPKSVFFLRPAS